MSDQNLISDLLAISKYQVDINDIVNRGEWLRTSPANFKGTNKDGKIDVGSSTTLHNCFCLGSYTMHDYIAEMFLLVSCSDRCKHLLRLHARSRGTKTYSVKMLLIFFNAQSSPVRKTYCSVNQNQTFS